MDSKRWNTSQTFVHALVHYIYNTAPSLQPCVCVWRRCQGSGDPGRPAARLHVRGRRAGRERRAWLPAGLHHLDHVDQHADRHHHVRQLVHHRLSLLSVHHLRLQLTAALWLSDSRARLWWCAPPSPRPRRRPRHRPGTGAGSDIRLAKTRPGCLASVVDFLLLACCAYRCCNV